VADWGLGRWCVCMLQRESNCSLARATDDQIIRCGITTSCQSAATSVIVKALLGMCSSCKQRYIKYRTFTFPDIPTHNRPHLKSPVTLACLAQSSLYLSSNTTLCLRKNDTEKNDTDVTHYRFNPHQPISVIFGRDVAERVCY